MIKIIFKSWTRYKYKKTELLSMQESQNICLKQLNFFAESRSHIDRALLLEKEAINHWVMATNRDLMIAYKALYSVQTVNQIMT